MSTLADIKKASDTDVRTYVDDSTPPGHFLATGLVLGIRTEYLLRGALDDDGAPIVGRIEWGPRTTVAVGSGIKGGYPVLGGCDDSASAFQLIVDRCDTTR